MSGPRVLIVDDDASIRGLLRVLAERAGVVADEAADGIRTLELLGTKTYDAVLLDLAMPLVNGFDIINRLKHKTQRPVVIVLSALNRATFADLDPKVVHCVIRKPFDVEMVMALMVSAATELHQQRERMAAAQPPLDAGREFRL